MIICPTLQEEQECLESIEHAFALNSNSPLNKEAHLQYLLNGLLNPLPTGYTALDASRPWLFFWILRSLSLLDSLQLVPDKELVIGELLGMQAEEGGFKGNSGSAFGAHLAATYAGCAALKLLGASDRLDKVKIYQFLIKTKTKQGTFMVQLEGGEEDLRGVYCAVAVASICKLPPGDLNVLFDQSVIDNITKCQTFEGGLGAVPWAEAHGGYTYCGLASLAILERLEAVDCKRALEYCKRMQSSYAKGFRGRTSKLVDGCYSFWQGASVFILSRHVGCAGADWDGLKGYILGACQDHMGGLRDKPGKSPDYYHTCYCLSGLALCADPVTIDPLLNC